MENKTSTNHENGNDANRLLPAVLLDVNERYYFKTRGQEPDVECTQRCMFRDNGICIGSAACQKCEYHFENNVDEWGCISWIKCRKINEAVFKNGGNGKGLCVRAVIENLNFKYRTNDK